MLPMGFGYVEGVTHDYKRHGTTTLFAALMLNGAALAACKPRHRHQEFLFFLREIEKAVPAALAHALHSDLQLVAEPGQTEGLASLQDRSSRPKRLRQPTPPEVIERIASLRRQRMPGKEIAATVGAEPDITMPELVAKLAAEKAVTAHPASLSRVLLKAGLSFKKNTAG